MADFRIRVVVDPTQASRGAAVVRRELDATSGAATRLRTTLAATFGAAVLTAGIRASIGLLADFDQQMSTVRAVSGATAADFALLREEAQRLGTTTRFTATQAAEGMVELSRAGLDATQTLQTTQDVLRLAQAGALGLGEAAGITVGVLAGFRLETDQAGRVVDVLAKGANSAKTTVSELGQALSFVAPVSAGLSISLEQTTAAVLALSNAGLESSRAGTGLRRVLTTLESPAENVRAILRDFGITNVREVQPSIVGLEQALIRLNEAQLQTGASLEIFGDRGGPAAEVLRALVGDVGEFRTQLEAAGGTAQATADIMDDNLNGALLSLTSAIQGVVLEFGALGATSFLTGIVRNLAAGFRFLASNLDVVLQGIKAVVLALSVTLARQAIPLAIGGLRLLGVQLGRVTALALANPFTALAAGIVLAVSAINSFGDLVAVSEDGLVSLKDVAVATFAVLTDQVQPFLTTLRDRFSAALEAVQARFRALTGGIGFGDLLRATTAAVGALIRIWQGLSAAIAVALDRVAERVEPIARGIREGFGDALAQAISLFTRFATSASSALGTVSDLVSNVLASVTGVVGTVIGGAIELLGGLAARYAAFIDGFLAGFGDVGTGLRDLLGGVAGFANAAIGLFNGLFQAAAVIFGRLVELIGSVLSPEFFRGIGTILSSVFSFVGRALGAVLRIAQRGLELIGVAVSNIQDQLPELEIPGLEVPTAEFQNFGADVAQAFSDGFNQDFVGNVSGAIGGVIDDIGARARERAASRAAEAAAAEAAASNVTPGGGGVVAAGGPVIEEDERVVNDFTKTNAQLEAQAEVLQALIDRGTAAAEVARLQSEENLNLNASEVALLEQRVRQNAQLELQAQILDEIRGPQEELLNRQQALVDLFAAGKIELAEFEAQMRLVGDAIGVTASQAALLDELRGPQEAINQRQRDLNVLFEQGRITQDEFQRAMGEANLRAAELAGGLEGGVNGALQSLINRSNEFGASIQSTLTGAFDQGLDALIEFTTTGKANFSDLASSILKDLAKIALQQATTGALGAAFGGGGGAGFASLFGFGGAGGGAVTPGGLQQGGQFTVGGSGGADSRLVAFPASPGEEVTVRRPDQQAPSMQPVIVSPPAVNVVTVRDPNEVPNGIRSKDGREAMLAVISENPDTIKSALGLDQS